MDKFPRAAARKSSFSPAEAAAVLVPLEQKIVSELRPGTTVVGRLIDETLIPDLFGLPAQDLKTSIFKKALGVCKLRVDTLAPVLLPSARAAEWAGLDRSGRDQLLPAMVTALAEPERLLVDTAMMEQGYFAYRLQRQQDIGLQKEFARMSLTDLYSMASDLAQQDPKQKDAYETDQANFWKTGQVPKGKYSRLMKAIGNREAAAIKFLEAFEGQYSDFAEVGVERDASIERLIRGDQALRHFASAAASRAQPSVGLE